MLFLVYILNGIAVLLIILLVDGHQFVPLVHNLPIIGCTRDNQSIFCRFTLAFVFDIYRINPFILADF